MADNANFPPNIQELQKKALEIYSSLSSQYLKDNNGKYIAIDPDSGEYFIGETREAAVALAHAKYPGKVAFVRRIGIVEKASRNLSSVLVKNNYGRLL